MNKLFKKINVGIRIIKNDGLFAFLYIFITYAKGIVRQYFNKATDYYELEIPKEEVNSVFNKKGTTIFIITALPFYDVGGGQRGAQLARAFNDMGYNVEFFYSNPSSDKRNKYYEIPVSTHTYVDDKAKKYIAKTSKEGDIFIFESPMKAFDEIIDIAITNKCKIIYENIDNWETSLGNSVLSKEVLIKLLTHADVLVGTAKLLVDQLEEYLEEYSIDRNNKQIVYLPNAVNDEIFCGAKKYDKPTDLVEGKKTFVYHGSLYGEWFDWELLIGFATNNPEFSINLIGDCSSLHKIIKRCPSNIHFLGAKLQYLLPAYLQYADFALLPFKRGEIGDYVSPIKIFEYISMYSNVLSTSLPDIEGYPNVYFGDSFNEWEDIVYTCSTADKDIADSFVSDNTWVSRAEKLIKELNKGICDSAFKNNLSIVVLNYNNMNVIFKCVNSLLKYRKRYGYNIVVVDNGSTDGSFEEMNKRYEKEEYVTICQNKQNGCASGRNLGVSLVNTDYLLFLDSDQWVTNSYWLEPYENVIKECEGFGAIGWAGGFFTPMGTTGKVASGLPYRGILPQSLYRNDIGYLGSGGMLIKKELFDSINGFDEAYDPTCFEDTDLSLKVRAAGKELYYCPYLGVIHLPHQTTENVFEEESALVKRNKEYFLKKWKNNELELLKKYVVKVINN